ncbi:MAG: glycosyltransferase [Actinobacteria bacterium]|nr:glycosyltransferase [Actinomycetota bacterium]MBU1493840.1 glycosyltransferase [Actinomycetota bacterium]MBU1866446.1 glycosyltransferase [Actinomycetota bacterium]
MHIGFLNPQGNFDPGDSYWTEHADFGGQLVYVKQVALALGEMGHRVDILTRRIVDADWPPFANDLDVYPDAPNVRIVRVPAGEDDRFLPKEDLWPFLGRDWVPGIIDLYRAEGSFPDAFTGHYGDGGLAAVLLRAEIGIPFTFTAHSLGAQKMDKLEARCSNLTELEDRYHFASRLVGERLAMNHSGVNITSTRQERFEQYGHHAYREAVSVDDDARFAVVPPGVNLAIFGSDARAATEAATRRTVDDRLARDLDPGRLGLPVVVASSRLDPKKNHFTIVEAFATDDALRRTANLVILTGSLDDPLHSDDGISAGELAVLRPLRELIASAGLEGSVAAFALPGQERLAAAYRYLAERRSVFCLTALYEPFGLAPLEAAAAGLPLAVTRNGGPSESLVQDGIEYGVLVDPADVASVAAGLLRALGPEWDDLAARGRQRVLDRYTWDRTAEGYLGAIERAMANAGGSLLPIPAWFGDPGSGDGFDAGDLAAIYLV